VDGDKERVDGDKERVGWIFHALEFTRRSRLPTSASSDIGRVVSRYITLLQTSLPISTNNRRFSTTPLSIGKCLAQDRFGRHSLTFTRRAALRQKHQHHTEQMAAATSKVFGNNRIDGYAAARHASRNSASRPCESSKTNFRKKVCHDIVHIYTTKQRTGNIYRDFRVANQSYSTFSLPTLEHGII